LEIRNSSEFSESSMAKLNAFLLQAKKCELPITLLTAVLVNEFLQHQDYYNALRIASADLSMQDKLNKFEQIYNAMPAHLYKIIDQLIEIVDSNKGYVLNVLQSQAYYKTLIEIPEYKQLVYYCQIQDITDPQEYNNLIALYADNIYLCPKILYKFAKYVNSTKSVTTANLEQLLIVLHDTTKDICPTAELQTLTQIIQQRYTEAVLPGL
jgi:hypothetical protein